MRSGIKLAYLLDTNVLIDFIGDRLVAKYRDDLLNRIEAGDCGISAVAVTEALAGGIELAEREKLEQLIDKLTILDYGQDLIPLGASIRRQLKLKLPDSLIAATALFHGLTLISSDTRGFHLIDALALERPEIA